ncbi:hypothetical protein HELRODRAFT_155740 [Helobdella robusta]|uniref:Tubulin--tyrosine ligase-like protein 9 n=1 Tax=Helobdella robusta TaxID=6412 RepID=T1ELL8_HELRO|nr:hypothetical protein HELRODRAFT_155740 [Helobdella robusta]ESO06681.1 hypothetical protein HELRODRAFT_155740 [Helobdella robusta]
MSSITPTVVRNCVLNSGFSFTNRTNAWLGTWCRNIKTPLYKNIKDYQKFNHFPAIYQIGRKDHLHRNITRMVNNFGSEQFGFTPQTFILPANMKAFFAAWKANPCKKWIIKPPASARGLGIKVVSKVDDALVSRMIIIQKYISNPYLIDGNKFDMRIYVYVSCFNPLRVYMGRNGLARFATAKYSNKQNSLKNRFVHLTNYSINKKNSDLEVIDSSNAADGTLLALWNYLDKKGVNSKMIWESIKDIVVKTIVSSETHIRNLTSLKTKNPYCCHELLGFDVLLDQDLKTWLLEVNISPSLHSSTELDRSVKEPMIVDILNTAGYRIPESFDLISSGNKHVDWNTYTPSNNVCIDKRFHNRKLSHDDKEKHSIYQQAFLEQEKLTANDLKVLIDTIDEQKRCGLLEVVYPTRSTLCYLKYFDNPHYYNLLVQAWCIRYPTDDAEGIIMLNKYCWHELHLKTTPSSNHE